MVGIVVDSEGGVLLTGEAWNSRDSDCYTARFAGADGSLLWERRHDSGPGGQDRAQAIALDRWGNVVITGYVDGGGDISGFGGGHRYTAKYATRNGSVLWERRDEHVAPGEAVVVAWNGEVVVSGADFNPSGFGELGYHTAVYDGSNGRLLVESRLPDVSQSGYLARLTSRSIGFWAGVLALVGSLDGDVVTVRYHDAVPVLSDLAVSRGPAGVQIRFKGSPGVVYRLERASTLSKEWSLLGRPVASSDGVVEYLDDSPAASAAFYRVQQP